MNLEALDRLSKEGKIIPCVRNLAQTALTSGYTSVAGWLKNCTIKEISLLAEEGANFRSPDKLNFKEGKIVDGYFELDSDDIEDADGDEVSYYTIKTAAAILANTAGVEPEERLPQEAAEDMLNTIIFAELFRRKTKLFNMDLSAVGFDVSLYTEMLSKKMVLKDLSEDNEKSADAARMFKYMRKVLDDMQTITRCRVRKEYIPTHLADALHVPIDLFSNPKYLERMKSQAYQAQDSFRDVVKVKIIPFESKEEFEKFKQESEINPDIINSAEYQNKVIDLSEEDARALMNNPEAFTPRMKEILKEAEKKAGVPPVASISDEPDNAENIIESPFDPLPTPTPLSPTLWGKVKKWFTK